MLLATDAHLGTKNVNFQMDSYVFKRRADEAYMMAARVIVAIENPQDIIIQSARPYGQRAPLARRHTAGTFTNQMQKSFTKPRLLILTGPRTDHQLEPRETKDQEADEGVAPVADFGVTEYGGGGVPVAGVDAAWEPVAPPVHAVDAAVIPPAADWDRGEQ
ncbi:hypothetical protein MKW98_013887 [Papaver atlanticum]|uniref:40S ribosomal protein SA n=1 Tax=Papaver atlanticum TaxID=357466 RepID=A0AAD4XCQ3_9MAGN|nr:hypothetical protein MKW98_013887 [Papaver atlanticum]